MESELATFTAANPGTNLVAVHPTGPTVGDELYGVPLTAQWVTPTLREAAAVFLAYLRSPAGSSSWWTATSGCPARTPATVTTPAGAPDTSAEIQTLPDGGPAVATALAQAIGATPAG